MLFVNRLKRRGAYFIFFIARPRVAVPALTDERNAAGITEQIEKKKK